MAAMRIFTFVDLHEDEETLAHIKNEIRKNDPELVVCAGDFSIFENKFHEVLKELNSINKPMLIIPGNHEDEETLEKACGFFENLICFHGKTYEKDDFLFVGFGTGGFSISDPNFKEVAPEFKKKIMPHHKVVLVTHAPPHGTNIDLVNGDHCGSKAIREFIKEVQPLVAISGHIHENSYKEDFIGRTRIINPGPRGKIIDL